MANTDLHGVAFPKLGQRELDVLTRCHGAVLRHYRDGEPLIRRGERGFAFFVVSSGTVAVVDDAAEPPRTLAVLERGEFTGEVAQLTGGVSFVSAVAQGEVDAYAVSAEGVRAIINQSPDLGDRILQAFIALREILRERSTFTGLRVIGSSYSKDTFRIREFLAKNEVPFSMLDLEHDPQVN